MNQRKYPEPDTLVALLKEKRDLSILEEEGWYRIPVKSAPKLLERVKYLAFYQPKTFGEEKWRVQYYGRIKRIDEVKRIELLPHESSHPRRDERYHRIEISDLQALPKPIVSYRGRRIVFIPTTFEKLRAAEELNDLFHDSPLEDDLWLQLKKVQIEAERQYYVQEGGRRYCLDFALLCREGKIDVECDGDQWHHNRKIAPIDNKRDNFLHRKGWHVLRYSTVQLQKMQTSLNEIKETIYQCGGIVPTGKPTPMLTDGPTLEQVEQLAAQLPAQEQLRMVAHLSQQLSERVVSEKVEEYEPQDDVQ